MTFWLGLVIGLSLGSLAGFVVAGLLRSAKTGTHMVRTKDDRRKRVRRKEDW